MRTFEELGKALPQIEKKIGYQFKDKNLLLSAFVHRSFNHENRAVAANNERLEFLGDSVLQLLVTLFLYKKFPEDVEGRLSFLRSLLVEKGACAAYINVIGIESFVLMGKGEAMHTNRGRTTILANLFEAVVGAIYLDGGVTAAHQFFFTHFTRTMLKIIENPMRNWKDELQDYCQKRYQAHPKYEILEERGASHKKTFYMAVTLDGHILGQGKGKSKKEAGQMSARQAIQTLESR